MSPSTQRGFLAAATAAGTMALDPAGLRAEPGGSAVHPFRINASEEVLVDLRRSLVMTRWPDRETVADDSPGVPLATMRDLARYWATNYASAIVGTEDIVASLFALGVSRAGEATAAEMIQA